MATAITRLYRDYEASWLIERADFWTLTATRYQGTRVQVVAGAPEVLLAKLDGLPKQSAMPGILMLGPGWPSGMSEW
jgi:hypothetical protein